MSLSQLARSLKESATLKLNHKHAATPPPCVRRRMGVEYTRLMEAPGLLAILIIVLDSVVSSLAGLFSEGAIYVIYSSFVIIRTARCETGHNALSF
jgi:hypothetical protein